MKTIICGGRDYSFTDADYKWLDQLKESLPITEVVSGGAKGADANGEIWAKLNCLPICKKAADWDNVTAPGAVIRHTRTGKPYNVLAGHWRNQQMADYAEACIVFPGGSGTADMVRRAKANGLKVLTSPRHT